MNRNKIKERRKMMEKTTDNTGTNILKYCQEDILKIKDDLSNYLKIKPNNISYRKSKSTGLHYLNISYNHQDYDIRFVDHTLSQPADTDRIVLNCRYDKGDNEFIIEASIHKYNSDYLSKIIRKIDRAITFFSDYKEEKKIKTFIVEQENSETFSIDNYFIEPYDKIKDLALLYLEENNIEDSHLNTKFTALCKIMHDIQKQRKKGK